jgi:serine protease Do
MYINQVKSTCAVLSAFGVVVIAAPPAWADNGQGRPQPSPVQKAENLIHPAVVYIEEQLTAYVGNDKGWFNDLNQPVKMSFRCTGFVVNPAGYVATAGHCVDPGAEGARGDIIKAIAQQDAQHDATIDPDKLFNFGMANWKVEGAVGGSPIDQGFAVLRGGANGDKPQSFPARVVDFRPVSQGDVALLKVEASDMASSELATDTDVEVGQQIISVGYPGSTDKVTDESMDPDNKDGTVSAKKTAGSVPVYETNAALSGGMSGGPTVGLDGRVVGINSRGPAGETQAFNFIAPAAGLAELLNRNGVKAQLGPLDVQFRNGLNDYYAGHYTSAIASFDKILALAPTYQQAAVFKTNATKARDQYGDVSTSSGSKTILYIVGGLGAALVAIAAVVVAMMIRRRGNRQRPQPGGAPPGFAGPTQYPAANSGPLPVYNPAGPPDATSGPMPVFDPAGPPTAWPGPQSPTSSVEQTGPSVTAPTATAPVTFDSSTEPADRAGGNGQINEGVKLEQIKTLAALRDSGALTQAEFEAEKRKILDGR